MSHYPIPAARLGDVGKAIADAIRVRMSNKPGPETKQYMLGLWTRAAARNRHNTVLHREMLAKAEQFVS